MGGGFADFTLTNPGGTVFLFDSSGLLMSITDRTGRATNLHYTNGQLTMVQNSVGYLRFAYDGFGANARLISVTDSSGRTVHYEYNYNGQLSAFTDTAGRTQTFFYTAILDATDGTARNLLSEIRDFTGNVILLNEFDNHGRVIHQTRHGGSSISIVYDDANRTNHVTDNRGRTVSYQYNEIGKLSAIIEPTGTTTFEYDERGWLISRTDRVGNTTNYTYFENGRIAAIAHPDGFLNTTGLGK